MGAGGGGAGAAGALRGAAAAAAVAGGVLAGGALAGPAPARAFGPVSMPLTGLEVKRVDCKQGQVGVTGGTRDFGARCLEVSATADNPSQQPLRNADVFGRVYDVNGEPAIDAEENSRISYIKEIVPGRSRVTFGLIVPEEQARLGDLELKNIKATGFPGGVLPGQGSGLITDCDEYSAARGECEDLPF